MKIIHQKYDMHKLTIEQVASLHKMLKETFPESYLIISTPTDITQIDGDDTIITIDTTQYTANELLEIIEKSQMYDGLNK